jgi:hypothetical protein
MSVNMTARVATKECSMGVVTGQNWKNVFLVIENGKLRTYLTDFAYEKTPEEFLFEAPLDKDFKASPWKKKEYSEVSNDKRDFYCFYLQQAGMFGNTKLLKIGLDDMETVEKLLRCIEANTKNPTTKSSK